MFESCKSTKDVAKYKRIPYFHLTTCIFYLFEPRRIHRLPLLLLISSEFIGKRYAEFAEA